MKLRSHSFAIGLFAAAILSFNACQTGSESRTEFQSDVPVTFTESQEGSAEKYVASLAITGMSCQMMCGSMITKTLAGLDGVKNTEIEFESAEEANFAIVEFDARKVSEKEMIAAVEKIADGHYKVASVKVVHYLPANAAAESGATSYNQKLDYKLPNIFSVFSRLF